MRYVYINIKCTLRPIWKNTDASIKIKKHDDDAGWAGHTARRALPGNSGRGTDPATRGTRRNIMVRLGAK